MSTPTPTDADASREKDTTPQPNGSAHQDTSEHTANPDSQDEAHRKDGPPHADSTHPRPSATHDLHHKFLEQKGKLTEKKEHLKTKSKPPGGFDPTPLPDAPPGYTLKVTFHRAYNLPAGDLHLTSSDPFLHATLTAAVPRRHKEDPLLTHRTRTLRRTTEPVWEEDWIVANVPASGFTLKCRLYDEDWPDHDDRLGSVTIRVPRVDEEWEGLGGADGAAYEVRKRSGSKLAYLAKGASVVLCGGGSITPRLCVSVKVLGRSEPPHAQMYTVGPTAWVKHYSPMIGRLTGVKVNRDEQEDGQAKSERRMQKYDFQANEIQLSGPVLPRLYHRYVEFRPMIGRMFSSRGIRGRILHAVLHKQHNRIYNFDSSTEYGSFAPCSDEATLQFLRMAHFDEGGRIFTYVITLDGMMRFTETGKEFGIDLLSKHTMHSDVATYVACAGEFFIRRLERPRRRHHQHNSHSSGPSSSSPGHSDDNNHPDSEANGGHESNTDNNDEQPPSQQPHPLDNDDHHHPDNHREEKDPSDNHHEEKNSSDNHHSNSNNEANPPSPQHQQTHPPDHPPGGPPSSPPPRNPRLYQLIIDNDSGTYRPDKSTLPDLQSFLSRNFPGLDVVTMHCADEKLSEMKKAQREAKKREGGTGNQGVMVVTRRSSLSSSSSGSSSSSEESRLGRLEGVAGAEEADEEPVRSKRERVFDVVNEPGRWREVFGDGVGNRKGKGKGRAAA